MYFAFTGGRQRTTSEYLTGNRKLSTIPVSLSMFMSLISGVYVIGQTGNYKENYIQNLYLINLKMKLKNQIKLKADNILSQNLSLCRSDYVYLDMPYMMSYLNFKCFNFKFKAEIYFHGTQVWVGLIGSVLGYVLCAIIFVPTFYRLKLISVYEVRGKLKFLNI